MLDYADSVEDYVAKCVSYYYLHELSESSKVMLQEMYNQCPDIINDSDEEFCNRIAINTFKAVGTEMLKSGVSYYWKEIVKNTIYVKNPYLLILQEAYNAGKYLTNTLFNTDSMTEKYFIMVASVNMNSVARNAYKALKNGYKENKTAENAAAYISAVDIVFNVLIRDCNAAYDYADSGDKAGVSKMLEEAYPNIFHQYEHLLNKTQSYSKEYDIHCPVDVYVYDGEELVASVVNNVPFSKGDITAAAYGDAKSFYFSKDRNYHFVYVGNGTGIPMLERKAESIL